MRLVSFRFDRLEFWLRRGEEVDRWRSSFSPIVFCGDYDLVAEFAKIIDSALDLENNIKYPGNSPYEVIFYLSGEEYVNPGFFKIRAFQGGRPPLIVEYSSDLVMGVGVWRPIPSLFDCLQDIFYRHLLSLKYVSRSISVSDQRNYLLTLHNSCGDNFNEDFFVFTDSPYVVADSAKTNVFLVEKNKKNEWILNNPDFQTFGGDIRRINEKLFRIPILSARADLMYRELMVSNDIAAIKKGIDFFADGIEKALLQDRYRQLKSRL